VGFVSENGHRRKFAGYGPEAYPGQVIAKVRQGRKVPNAGWTLVEVVKELQMTGAIWCRRLIQDGSEHPALDSAAPAPHQPQVKRASIHSRFGSQTGAMTARPHRTSLAC
jgi:hypothetical protein